MAIDVERERMGLPVPDDTIVVRHISRSPDGAMPQRPRGSTAMDRSVDPPRRSFPTGASGVVVAPGHPLHRPSSGTGA
jgi:hypothetical protein